MKRTFERGATTTRSCRKTPPFPLSPNLLRRVMKGARLRLFFFRNWVIFKGGGGGGSCWGAQGRGRGVALPETIVNLHKYHGPQSASPKESCEGINIWGTRT